MLRTDCKSWWSMWVQKHVTCCLQTQLTITAKCIPIRTILHSWNSELYSLPLEPWQVSGSWYSEAQMAGLFNEHSWRSSFLPSAPAEYANWSCGVVQLDTQSLEIIRLCSDDTYCRLHQPRQSRQRTLARHRSATGLGRTGRSYR